MVFPLLQKSAGILEHCKISNSKHQLTNKYQIRILKTKTGLKFGISVIVICLIFDICDLEFLFLQ